MRNPKNNRGVLSVYYSWYSGGMRKLILTRGAPGSGKTTVLRKVGLGPYTLSMDALRLMRMAPVMGRNGEIGVDQSQNNIVAEQFFKLIQSRMERGELIAADTTMPLQRDLNPFLELARAHRYQIAVVDFSDMPREEVHRRNRSRHAHEQVPEKAVDRIYNLAQQHELDFQNATVFRWDGTDAQAKALVEWMAVPILDLSGYKQVVHIGDLQGCFSVLTGLGGPLEHGFDDNTAYIFVGDLPDRGIENGVLIKWFAEQAVPRPNVFLLWGNHEDHLDRLARGVPPVSPEFRERTLPQLIHAGVTPEDAKAICDKAVEVLPYIWNGQKVLVTHAGLANVPAQLEAISLYQYSHGTGQWEDPVDEQFERHSDPSWIQVHGHRNHGNVPVQATPRSFNLEDSVEFGGNLRTVTLDRHGWTPGEYRNNVYLAHRARPARPPKKGVEVPLAKQPPAWMDRPSETRMDDQTLAAMTGHPGVRQRTSKRAPHVASLNFTKDVFFKASWDDVLVKARGLFLNQHTQEIVGRGYEKFFNVGERAETQMEALKASMAFPVAAYVKENGYLGNLGYDTETGNLFYASKSTPDGDFADWFREIFDATVPAGKRDFIRRWLRDNEASMVFEVIDPVRDPHMIDYPAAKVVLLDIFHRSAQPEKLEYDHLKAVAGSMGLEVKRRAMLLPTPQAFEGWHNKVTSDLSWRFQGREDIEGVVIEDKAGYQTKVKLPHYAFWKRMRSAKERLAKQLERREEIGTNKTVERRDALLAEIAENKAIIKAHHGEGKLAELARSKARDLGQELMKVQQSLRGVERAETIDEEIAHTLGRDTHPLAQAFLTWASQQPAAVVKDQSILQLRATFMEQVKPDPALWNVPWVAFANGNEDDSEPEAEALTPSVRKQPKP